MSLRSTRAGMSQDYNRERDIDAALETASNCRRDAAIYRQMKMFPELVKWLIENAKAAERWATKR
jgi:hypothetical protein